MKEKYLRFAPRVDTPLTTLLSTQAFTQSFSLNISHMLQQASLGVPPHHTTRQWRLFHHAITHNRQGDHHQATSVKQETPLSSRMFGGLVEHYSIKEHFHWQRGDLGRGRSASHHHHSDIFFFIFGVCAYIYINFIDEEEEHFTRNSPFLCASYWRPFGF